MRGPVTFFMRWLVLNLSRSVALTGRRLAEFSEKFLRKHPSIPAGRILNALVQSFLAVSRKLASAAERVRKYWDSGL